MKYIAGRGATDLSELDIFENQIEKAKEFLKQQGIDEKLICLPMENECGLPD